MYWSTTWSSWRHLGTFGAQKKCLKRSTDEQRTRATSPERRREVAVAHIPERLARATIQGRSRFHGETTPNEAWSDVLRATQPGRSRGDDPGATSSERHSQETSFFDVVKYASAVNESLRKWSNKGKSRRRRPASNFSRWILSDNSLSSCKSLLTTNIYPTISFPYILIWCLSSSSNKHHAPLLHAQTKIMIENLLQQNIRQEVS
ncbi:hypothetical protein DY000_02017430 [Brassica cretica]|uniref:DUF4005 domain-containing protein n=1 Tax=Brassica cretica TaxID=69181 RepID=A0ABQ7CPG9_BRACR|nr:hypothetical protein DY000_02017430 [Brassica cretica]